MSKPTGVVYSILCALVVLGSSGCGRARAASASIPIEVVTAVRQQSARSGSLSGRVEAIQTATLSGEVAERVSARPIQRGQRVRRGQVLLRFREDALRQQLAEAEAGARRCQAGYEQAQAALARVRVETGATLQSAEAGLSGANAQASKMRRLTRNQELRAAEAALEVALANEELARKEFVRYQSLVAEDAIPQQTLDQAQASLDSATARRRSAEQSLSLAREGSRREDQLSASAQVDQAQATLAAARARPYRLAELEAQVNELQAQTAEARARAEQARIRLDKCCIRAPFDSVVLDTRIEEGELAVVGQPLLKLGDIHQVKALFSVPEATRGQLGLGQRLSVSADALNNRAFQGTLTLLGAEAEARSRTFPLEVTVDNPALNLLPNMIVRLQLSTRSASPPLLVPMTAVVTRSSSPQVFVLRDHLAHARTVRLGQPVGDSVEILEGLSEGEKVAVTPIRLAQGQRVQEVQR
jgi:HlyD family secretion protein